MEPGRKTAYSTDLRWRVIWQKLGMGLGYRQIAHHLNISVGTVYNTYKLFEPTGSVEAKKARKRPELCKLDDRHQLYVIGLVLDNPKMYLSEVCHQVKEITNTEVSSATICNLPASYGITRKKVQHVALQRRVDYRGLFVANVSFFRKKCSFGWMRRAATTVKCLENLATQFAVKELFVRNYWFVDREYLLSLHSLGPVVS